MTATQYRELNDLLRSIKQHGITEDDENRLTALVRDMRPGDRQAFRSALADALASAQARQA